MNTDKTWTWNKQFHYPPSTRSTTDGLRTYDVGNEKLPSVTTILGNTKSSEAQESIARWQAKVGKEQATRIKEQAASRGTNVHTHLEKYILGEGHLDLTPEGKIAKGFLFLQDTEDFVGDQSDIRGLFKFLKKWFGVGSRLENALC